MRRKVFAWSLYDLANTAYSALIVTTFFPVLITKYLGGSAFHVGLAMSGSLLLAGLLVPFFGAISDATRIKKPFIITFTLITVALTGLIAYSNLTWALLFMILANLFYHAAIDIYDSYLPLIATPREYGRVSGMGTAFGYLGTVLSVGMALLILYIFGGESLQAIQVLFIASAVFFLVNSIYPFFVLHDPIRAKISAKDAIKTSFSEMKDTITNLKKYKYLWFFLIASLLYVDGLNTVIVFLFLFGQSEFGLTIVNFLPLLAIMGVTAFLGSLIFGKLTDIIGPKHTLITSLILWIAMISALILDTSMFTYILSGLIGGALLGGIWTATRPMLIELAPKNKIAELFGFQGLTEKFGAAIGPAIFGYLAVTYNYDVALGSVLLFFIAGLALLIQVKLPAHSA